MEKKKFFENAKTHVIQTDVETDKIYDPKAIKWKEAAHFLPVFQNSEMAEGYVFFIENLDVSPDSKDQDRLNLSYYYSEAAERFLQ